MVTKGTNRRKETRELTKLRKEISPKKENKKQIDLQKPKQKINKEKEN